MREFRWFDAISILFAIGCILLVTVYAYSKGDARYLTVGSGGTEWVYPLEVDTVIRVPGTIGETIVEISHSTAHVVDSPCRDKICVTMGVLQHSGDWSACLPNGVMVRIDGDRSDGIDAIAF